MGVLEMMFSITARRIFRFIKPLPKSSVLFAKEYFKDKSVVIVEIGVWKGSNAKDLNRNLNVRKFYLIDCYDDYDDYEVMGKKGLQEESERIAHRRNALYSKTNVWIKKYSSVAVKDIKEGLDFVYIDGNHKYNYVKRDLKLYWDKLKVGGILAGHDIDQKDVSEAVIEFVKENNLEIQFGASMDWWIIK